MIELRNEFLTNIVAQSAKEWTRLDTKMPVVMSEAFFYGNLKGDVIPRFGGGPCYGELDGKTNVFKDAFVWFPPNKSTLDYRHNNPKTKGVLEARQRYSEVAFFRDDSPWRNVIAEFGKEMFEGYDTVEDKAKLVAQWGWFVGPNAFNTLSKVHLGAFAVFTRRQNTYMGVRRSLEYFLDNKLTRDLPVQWNIFAAHHIFTQPDGLNLREQSWNNGHNPFYPNMYPLTAAGFVTQTVDIGKPSGSWVATKGVGSWQRHNSDRVFPELLMKQPKYQKIKYKAVKDRDEFSQFLADDDVLNNLSYYKDTAKLNLWYWENRVAPYI